MTEGPARTETTSLNTKTEAELAQREESTVSHYRRNGTGCCGNGELRWETGRETVTGLIPPSRLPGTAGWDRDRGGPAGSPPRAVPALPLEPGGIPGRQEVPALPLEPGGIPGRQEVPALPSEPGGIPGRQEVPALPSEPGGIPGRQEVPALPWEPGGIPGRQEVPALPSEPGGIPGRQEVPALPLEPGGIPGKQEVPALPLEPGGIPGKQEVPALPLEPGGIPGRQDESGRAGRHEVWSWKTASKESLCLMWQKVKVQLMLSMSFLTALFWYCRRLYSFLAQLLKRWSNYLQRQLIRNLSVLPEVDLLGYSAREWKGETKQAKQMREAYEELFRSCHIKYLRQVRRDNYSVIRAVLFQIFSQGIPFPSWMKERDILKLPEKLLYSQGCNWIQQYSFGPERYTGPNAFGKLRKCMETLKTNWAEISATRDHEERGSMCNTLFSDESKEYKLYEAIKFIMLYEVVEAYEQIKSRGKPVHNLFSLLFDRDSSSDPLSFMMNHLNSIGDSICLDQVELFLLGYLLEVKIRVYRLHRFNTEEFQVKYPAEYRREWNEIALVTEDDHYYHIPLFRT